MSSPSADPNRAWRQDLADRKFWGISDEAGLCRSCIRASSHRHLYRSGCGRSAGLAVALNRLLQVDTKVPCAGTRSVKLRETLETHG